MGADYWGSVSLISFGWERAIHLIANGSLSFFFILSLLINCGYIAC